MNPSRESRAWPSTALVFAAALALRIAHVLALRASPYFARPVLDAETYYWATRALAAGEGWAEGVYWQPPGCPYFLAAILRVVGAGFLAPRLVQAVLGALTAALTCAIGTRVFGRAVNNPRYDATVGMQPGRDWQALVRAPRLHGVSGAGPASRFFVERVTGYAGHDPAGFLGLQARKLRLLLGGTEIPRNQEIYPARAWSPVLRVLLWKVRGLAFPFGLLLPFAVVGLGVAWRRSPILAASVVLLGLAVAAFFVTGRYRAPLIPLLALFAAAGVRWAAVEARAWARDGGRRRGGRLPPRQRGPGADAAPDESRRGAGPGPLARA